MREEHVDLASELMVNFGNRTGLSSNLPPRRYLWTDAFAVCTFLGLANAGGRNIRRELAVDLVNQVHQILGRHRPEDTRTGWISGLDEVERTQHPTRGGLRIGKPLPERRADEPYDPQLEWDRDGQYFHYLTRWMHALNQLSRMTGNPVPLRWAMELAATAHAGFTYRSRPAGPPRMYWKMSIDLTYPLVPSMGQHDPLDGYVVFSGLQASGPAEGSGNEEIPDLQGAIMEQAAMCAASRLATDDPLGIGSLLMATYQVARLIDDGQLERTDLLAELLDAATVSLPAFGRTRVLHQSAATRLAFRELGLAIGLHAVERLAQLVRDAAKVLHDNRAVQTRVDGIGEWLPLKDSIEAFWLEPAHRRTRSWMAHEDINTVMLATSLAPDGYLGSA